jgi:hypothetical protein
MMIEKQDLVHHPAVPSNEDRSNYTPANISAEALDNQKDDSEAKN